MSPIDIIRAWKDPAYRRGLTPEQRAQLPENPAGSVEIDQDHVQTLKGGHHRPIITTAITCTEYTFNGWNACCH